MLSPAAAAGDWQEVARSFFPSADRVGELEGDPPAAAVFKAEELLGYVFHSNDVVNIPAYSGKPVNLLIGIDTRGVITGTKVVEHHEPILLVGIPEKALHDFVGKYVGKSVTDHVKVGAGRGDDGYVNIDAITGATVTVIVVNRTIMRAAQLVALSRGLIKPNIADEVPMTRVRPDVFQEADWKSLTGNGAVRRLLLAFEQVEEAFVGTPGEGQGQGGGCDPTAAGEACDPFIDLYYAHLNPPTVGRNLLGESQYNWLMSELQPGEHAIAVMANGVYSFKGSGYVRGGIFDRVQVMQGDQIIDFRDLDHHRLSDVYADGIPEFKEMAIFVIREQFSFNPGQEWSLALLVRRQTGPLDSVFTTFSANYEIPEAYIERPALPKAVLTDDEPMWVALWRERAFQIAVLLVGLSLLTLIMALQDWLVRFPRLISYLRTGFLIYTLLFIGWYMLGQLSVVNVLTFTNSVMHQFTWETFLIDPAMFILWTFVAGSLLLWGRGVYCGWLCPFGALQKLTNQLARYLHVPQLKLPQIVHDRLWGIKYLVLMVLFGISLQSLGTAERYAEIEPFKTAITLRFDRDLPFMLYAAALVLISAFNCKFYCKYICPLGAALAVPSKLRLVDWLRRRKECGKPCQTCARECEIQAIDDTGVINAIECHYCLDCQVTYWDDHKCPPLVERRKRREKAIRARESVRWMEKELGVDSGLEQKNEEK